VIAPARVAVRGLRGVAWPSLVRFGMSSNEQRGSSAFEYLVLLLLLGLTITGYGFALAALEQRAHTPEHAPGLPAVHAAHADHLGHLGHPGHPGPFGNPKCLEVR
jgi:hypothetical protein